MNGVTDGQRRIVDLSPAFVEDNIDKILSIASDQPGEYWAKDNFLFELPGKWTLSFAVILDNNIEGYAVVSIKSHKTAHIHHFMVSSGHRGRRIGMSMLDEVKARASAHGLQNITLKVARTNHRALEFYVRHGFLPHETYSELVEAEYVLYGANTKRT